MINETNFPYTVIHSSDGKNEVWKIDVVTGRYIETVSTGSRKMADDKFNRLHIEHYGSPANYSEGEFPNQRIKKMDVPWDMMDKIKIFKRI